ncbi:P2X purinoceptor 7 isoform X2 [Talpa occidentalis]|uniref:P2X purinoceptor 7 isoform X2 n=1 Tax=Talpa occidentalis TaxID=50954 RepID=UPI00188E3283|nr:P2X purinoceptor 7 isoform X2 [Talpa occidentalis]
MPDCCSCGDVFQYETVKVIRIQSANYGTIKWFLHMLVFSYVSFALVKDKLYQQKEPVISSVHTKVKGIAEVKETLEKGMKETVRSIFDTADYTFPVQGNSFFVMTNFRKTEGQEQGLCPEYPTRRTICSSDSNCKKGRMNPQSNGIQTGKCVKYYNTTKKTCEVTAWCPIETAEEAPKPALLNSAENFTVFIKNNIDFPGHNYTTRNIFPGLNTTCTFHKTRDPLCPIFRLGDIFQETGDNFSDVAIKGGIMGIEIYWDCNLDRWFQHCRPKYSFRRLDDKSSESLYPGYNFRYAKYYKENNVEKRTLIKVFGIRFDILVFGTATLFIDFLISTYSSKCCGSQVYRFCKCCEPFAVNEYYHKKKFENIVAPKSTLKYVSFVDESNIRMVDQQLLGRRLQDVKGEEVPRPLMEFRDLSRLALSVHPSPPKPGQPEEIELLSKEETSTSHGSPDWCQCGNCLPSKLPESHRYLEELCCRKGKGQCITTSEAFRKLILSRSTLQFFLLYEKPLPEPDADSSNRELRHCAYRCYTAWRFGSQDLADFAILPSCCRWRIRKEFPKSDGKYSGFKSPYGCGAQQS